MPASGRAIRAGRAFYELFADDKALTAGLKRAQKKFRAFGQGVAQLGRQFLGVGLAASAPFALSAKTFADFESQMARVKALTGAVGDDFEKLNTKAKQLGASTVFSASQSAEAMSAFALAGFDVNQILEAIGPALDLAAAGQLEVGEAADIAAKLMAGMGLEANELQGAVDVMAKSMTTANTDLQQLGDAFRYVGPIAKTAGVELEEVAASIQLLSNAGIQGEQAGSSLRGIILALTSPSKEAGEKLKELGIDVADAAGNMRPLADIIGDFEQALNGLGSAKKLEILGTVFPARQAAGAAVLIEQGAQSVRDATDALSNSAGTASRIAGTQLDTLKGDFTIIMSALEGVGIAIGEALGSQLRTAAQAISGALALLGHFISENKNLVVILASAAAGIAALGVVFIGLGGAAIFVSFAFGGLAAIVSGIGIAVSALASPFGIAIAAVIGAGAAFVAWGNQTGNIVAFIQERFAMLSAFVSKVVTAMGSALARGDISAAANVLWKTLRLVWLQGTTYLQGQWLSLKNATLNILTDLFTGAAMAVNNGMAAAESGFTASVTFMQNLWTKFTTAITVGWRTAQTFISKGILRLMALFDDSLDVEGASAILDDDLQKANEKSQNAAADAIKKRQTDEERRQRQIAAIQQGANDELLRRAEEVKAAREAGFENEIAASTAELEKAREEWRKALEAANAQTGELENGAYEAAQALQANFEGLDAATSKGTFASGGFDVNSLARQFGGSALDRTAKATEATAKFVEKIANNDNVVVFD